MSTLLIRQALENRLAAMPDSLPTAWENKFYDPTSGAPHQRAYILPANTYSPTQGGPTEFIQESGILQVSLYYPIGGGMAKILAQVELIRAWFYKGLTLTAGGIIVTVTKRASVAPTNREGEWVVCPVSVPYFSNLFV